MGSAVGIPLTPDRPTPYFIPTPLLINPPQYASMTRILYLLLLLLPCALVTSCEDNANDTDTGEFTHNWAARNADYFAERMSEAKAAIAEAKAAYGDDWESHCDWRVFGSYAKPSPTKQTDSICVKIVNRGTGTACPFYTDSIKVNYIGRLIPTESYPDGRIFDHSGTYETEEAVFSPDFSTPTRMATSNLIEGYTTAIQHMRINDRWKIYIPQELGYTSNTSGVMPAYSTLIFEVELKGFYRAGESVIEQ